MFESVLTYDCLEIIVSKLPLNACNRQHAYLSCKLAGVVLHSVQKSAVSSMCYLKDRRKWSDATTVDYNSAAGQEHACFGSGHSILGLNGASAAALLRCALCNPPGKILDIHLLPGLLCHGLQSITQTILTSRYPAIYRYAITDLREAS